MKALRLLLAIYAAVLIWSGIEPHDRFTWFLEVLPALLALGIVAWLWYARGWRFTPLVYTLICIHCVVLMIGGKYTYAEVPAFNWLRDTFHLARNYYDRVGHFMQGFSPAIIAREVLIRNGVLARPGWLNFIIVSIVLAFSAAYEWIEWWVALATGESATAFLGTQGDQWDTQWDMFMCTIGAILSLALLSRAHQRELDQLGKRKD